MQEALNVADTLSESIIILCMLHSRQVLIAAVILLT